MVLSPLNGKIMIENMLFFRPTEMSHMWYMPVIIGIYLFIPLIVNGLNHTDVRSMFIPLSVAFLALFVIPVVDVFLLANGKRLSIDRFFNGIGKIKKSVPVHKLSS